MNTRHVFGWMMVVLVIGTVQSFSEPLAVQRFINSTVEQSERNLALALSSGSLGLQTTAAQTVRDLKALLPNHSFPLLVIPLMRLVKDENGDAASRILAALALHDLRSAMGDFAIARTARFTECEQLKRLCWWLSRDRVMEEQQTAAERSLPLHRFLGEQQPEPLVEFDWSSR
ncbi:MAG TPA: hypothetical protein VFG32_04185 [Bacteroidota bacterium]|nr:hypothetical protein [Bacteroidota bacterium]